MRPMFSVHSLAGITLLLAVSFLSGCSTSPVDNSHSLTSDTSPATTESMGLSGLLDRLDQGILPTPEELDRGELLNLIPVTLPSTNPIEKGLLRVRSNNGLIYPDGTSGDDVWVMVEIELVANEAWDRPPLDMIILQDLSGSMEGETWQIANYFYQQLQQVFHPDDRIGLICMQDGTTLERFISPLEQEERTADWLEDFQPGGVADLDEGVSLGSELLNGLGRDPERDRRILLITDDPWTRESGISSDLEECLREDAEYFIGFSLLTIGEPLPGWLNDELLSIPGSTRQHLPTKQAVYQEFIQRFDQVVSPAIWGLTISADRPDYHPSIHYDSGYLADGMKQNEHHFYLPSWAWGSRRIAAVFHVNIRRPEEPVFYFGESFPLLHYDISCVDRKGEQTTLSMADYGQVDIAYYEPVQTFYENEEVRAGILLARTLRNVQEAIQQSSNGADHEADRILTNLLQYLDSENDAVPFGQYDLIRSVPVRVRDILDGYTK